MSRDIQALTALPSRFSLDGMGFRIKPHTLRVISEINSNFRDDNNPNGYQYAIDKIFKENDIEVAAEFIYLCLDKKPKEIESLSDFKKALLESNKDMALIFELVSLCLKDVESDISLEEEQGNKKKVLFGIILIVLAMIGMMHTLFWLVGYISALMTS